MTKTINTTAFVIAVLLTSGTVLHAAVENATILSIRNETGADQALDQSLTFLDGNNNKVDITTAAGKAAARLPHFPTIKRGEDVNIAVPWQEGKVTPFKELPDSYINVDKKGNLSFSFQVGKQPKLLFTTFLKDRIVIRRQQ